MYNLKILKCLHLEFTFWKYSCTFMHISGCLILPQSRIVQYKIWLTHLVINFNKVFMIGLKEFIYIKYNHGYKNVIPLHPQVWRIRKRNVINSTGHWSTRKVSKYHFKCGQNGHHKSQVQTATKVYPVQTKNPWKTGFSSRITNVLQHLNN